MKNLKYLLAFILTFTGLMLVINIASAQVVSWAQINDDGFGDANNRDAYGLVGSDGHIYVGTENIITGVEIWEYDGDHWVQINTDGFGDANNVATDSLIFYHDKLYVGANNSNGMEVWEYDGSIWTQVNIDGFGDANNMYAYSSVIFENKLYYGVTTAITGVEVWQYDGLNWTQINTDGFGDANNNEIYKLFVYDGNLIASTGNFITGGEIWQYDGLNWTKINTAGFGDANNVAVVDLIVFQGNLIAGTVNLVIGGGLWQYDGLNWTQINTAGFGDANSVAVYSLVEYYRELYLGSVNNVAGTEIWRYNGTSYEQVNVDGFGSVNDTGIFDMIVDNYQLYLLVHNSAGGVKVWTGEIPDFTGPTITDQNPANGAVDVGIDSNIYFELDDALSGVNTVSLDLSLGNTQIIDNGLASSGYNVTYIEDGVGGYDVTINPDTDFAYSFEVTVTLTVYDLLNNPTSTTWSFTTEAAPNPTITTITPSTITTGPSQEVVITGTNFDSGTIVKVISSSGTETTLASAVNPAGTELVITIPVELAPGTYDVKITNSSGGTLTSADALTVNHRIESILTVPNTNGTADVKIFNGSGVKQSNFYAFDNINTGSWFVTSADVNGDGIYEIVAAAGPNYAPIVRVYNQSGTKLYEFYAYQETFRGGVSLAAGDIENDGKDEIVTMPYSHGGALCRIFGLRGSQIQSTTENLWIFSDRNLRGGFSVTMPDFEGDGKAEIVATPLSLGSSHLQIFGYRASESQYRAVILGVKVHPESFHGGMTLGSGDIDGDGDDEVITGVYSNGGPVVIPIYRKSDGTLAKMHNGFMAYGSSFHGGVTVTTADTDANGTAEILVGVRTGDKAYVKRYVREDADTITLVNQFTAYPNTFTGGVNLGNLPF